MNCYVPPEKPRFTAGRSIYSSQLPNNHHTDSSQNASAFCDEESDGEETSAFSSNVTPQSTGGTFIDSEKLPSYFEESDPDAEYWVTVNRLRAERNTSSEKNDGSLQGEAHVSYTSEVGVYSRSASSDPPSTSHKPGSSRLTPAQTFSAHSSSESFAPDRVNSGTSGFEDGSDWREKRPSEGTDVIESGFVQNRLAFWKNKR
ncbi:uncharacterized protein I303_101557 [Kwoniella dejecticola CBS 10117]|uniref:Uncharacterized protein n=1 Tax=Kwoniella dejecticola CBS 10117 TaxID=1296121 RepID=A0A1A6ADF0_9TREE|nr:uncharacterized protein I303_02311 [Kwoniella dejecticola CBS 10117]OBR88092.1 hypothetical protein I303_02311 [Kwoniella dejecticola CBS 10117]